MPLYEYKCKKCKESFEVRRSMFDQSEVKCPRCGADDPQRIYSPFLSTSPGSSCSPGGFT